MNEFAGLAASADPAIGGYRVLQPGRIVGRRANARRRQRALCAGARAHARSIASVGLAAALGLIVLAGPASCPCDLGRAVIASAEAAPETWNVARFAYLKQTAIAAGHSAPPLATLDVAITEPDEVRTSGVSPISTATIGPLGAMPGRDGSASTARASTLPGPIETVADVAPKPIRLAGVRSGHGLVTIAPAVVATPPLPEITAVDVEKDSEAAAHPPRRHRSYRHRNATPRASRQRSARALASKRRRAPRWAQRMFVRPWQSKAFSYTD